MLSQTRSQFYSVSADASQTTLSMSMAVMLGLWSMVILLSPLYVFPSGVPQPADFLSVLLLSGLFALGRLRWANSVNQVLSCLGLFVLYTCVVNWSWAIILYSFYDKNSVLPTEVFLASTYYIFDLLIATAVASMAYWMGSRFVNATLIAIMLSIFIQATAAWQTASLNSEGERTTAFFENPNQLAYYAVLNASLILVLIRSGLAMRFLRRLAPLCFLFLIYLAVVSSSRAGLVGIGLACILLYADNLFRGLLLTLVLVAILFSGLFNPLADNLIDRSVSKNNGFWEELAYRGYDRMWNHPEYMVVGAGEGAVDRFQTVTNLELHSTPGTLLFSYGIFGSLLFALSLWSIFRKRGPTALLLLLPAFVYGLTHQGLRQSELWMLIMLVGYPFFVRSPTAYQEDVADERN